MSAANMTANNSVEHLVISEQIASPVSIFDGLLNEVEFCKKIKICRASLFKLRKAGLVGFVMKGRRIFYDAQSYQDYLANCEAV